jgi:hypothetical protein
MLLYRHTATLCSSPSHCLLPPSLAVQYLVLPSIHPKRHRKQAHSARQIENSTGEKRVEAQHYRADNASAELKSRHDDKQDGPSPCSCRLADLSCRARHSVLLVAFDADYAMHLRTHGSLTELTSNTRETGPGICMCCVTDESGG